jgi:hypothetical protein
LISKEAAEILLGILIYVLCFIALALGLFELRFVADYPRFLLVLAVLSGGCCGGLVLSLIGGEKLGLKFPGRPADSEPFQPGFLGDVFVGLMAAMVMFGVGAGVADLGAFRVAPGQDLVGAWMRNFGLALLSGFVGLNLIKRLSSQLIDKAEIASKLEEVGKQKTDTAYLLGLQAIRANQLDEAERYMRQALEAEGETNIRSYIGMAMICARRQQWGQAAAYLKDALSKKDIEKLPSRVAKAYFNSACYISAGSAGEAPTDKRS